MTQDSADGCKAVYVGNLDSRVNMAKLADLFPANDRIRRIKILPDRHVSLGNGSKGRKCPLFFLYFVFPFLPPLYTHYIFGSDIFGVSLLDAHYDILLGTFFSLFKGLSQEIDSILPDREICVSSL
jgi:hypothetical protein